MARRYLIAGLAAIGLVGAFASNVSAQTLGQPVIDAGPTLLPAGPSLPGMVVGSTPVANPPVPLMLPAKPTLPVAPPALLPIPSSAPSVRAMTFADGPAAPPASKTPPMPMPPALGPTPMGAPLPTPMPGGVGAPKTDASLSGLAPTELEKLIDERIKQKMAADEAAKKAEAERKAAEGHVVGDDLKLNATWDWGGFRYKTADEAFNVHFGGRMMYDGAWWSQSPQLKAPASLKPGSPLNGVTGVGQGIGDLQDGFYLRRARLVADGTIYQTIEFKLEVDFENYNSLLFDESYVGMKDLPFFDAIRIGQMHVPFGLEAYTSSRWLETMERSPSFDAFYQEFAPGIFANETFLDQRITAQQMFHRIDYFNQFNGASFGDGKYAFSTRVSGLPLYEDNGRYLIHLGLAYQIRSGSTPSDFAGGTVLPSTPPIKLTEKSDLVRFRVRPGVRDAVALQGDANRVIDTGVMIADSVQAVNAEFLAYAGPLHFQAECVRARVSNVFAPASDAAEARGNLTYSGAYAQAGIFLTGENRGYDMRFGKYDRVKPNEPFFLVRDENGNLACGLGAWEFVYRYGYVDLNDGAMTGGRYGEHTIGLNWYWNSNVKMQFNYINGQRVVPPGAASGTVQGFGVRAALEF